MGVWHRTGCILCAQNCGLELLVEENRIVKVRPDKANPRSEGYVCRKGMNIAHFQHHAGRLTHPLKRVGDGFERISWDQALDEIAARLRRMVEIHGPRCLAYMGGGGQGAHFEAAFGVRLLRALGSRYHYSPLAQELTGMFWVQGRAAGRQYLHTIPDHENTDMLVAAGWNGWMSHQMPQARRWLDRICRDPEKLLVVIDPRRSETAERADIHLAIRPGTDALLTRAMVAVVLQEGWEDRAYMERHVRGFEQIASWFLDFDARAAVEVCELDFDQVREVSRLFATRRSSLHPDLGILMNRHSTVTSYLELILLAVCGRIGVPGGNVFPGHLMPLGAHSDERDPRQWRTVSTGFPAIMGTYPPNVMPEEILSDHPERLRAVLVSASNPLRSYADTGAYERAFRALDLLVTVEVAMTETAALSHYVLPARSDYESWDGTFFAWTFPGTYFQMRRPVVKPVGEPRERGQIFTDLAHRLGLLPEIPRDLLDAAKGDRLAFGARLLGFVQSHPGAGEMMPFVLARTLGEVLGSAHLAALWGLLMTAPRQLGKQAARAGFRTGPAMGEEIFRAIVDHPEGLWIGRCDPHKNLEAVRTEDGRIDVYIPELEQWLRGIDATSEAKRLRADGRFPLILNAGRHMDMNANTIMRDPAWNAGRRACTLLMNPGDARSLNLADGQRVRVVTEADEVEIELEVGEETRPGMVLIPHGFGLEHAGETHGVNVNRLTSARHRDPMAGTPLHRYVLCRVEPA